MFALVTRHLLIDSAISFRVRACAHPTVQCVLRESQVIRESKEKQIDELKKMLENSADSMTNECEKKVRSFQVFLTLKHLVTSRRLSEAPVSRPRRHRRHLSETKPFYSLTLCLESQSYLLFLRRGNECSPPLRKLL